MLAPRLLDRAEILIGQLLVIKWSSVQLGRDGILSTAEQNCCGGQRFIGECIHKLM